MLVVCRLEGIECITQGKWGLAVLVLRSTVAGHFQHEHSFERYLKLGSSSV
jgi:hypothetical protein